MANYIDDAGSYNYDATLTGTYTTDATNHTLTMGADGEADTGYTLPSSTSWLLVETYDIDGTAGDLGGTWFQDDVADVDTDLTAYRAINTALVTATTYTSFKMKATLFDGTDAKVYEATNATAFPAEASPTYTMTSWTPPTGTWKISDTLVAPENEVNLIDTISTSLTNSGAGSYTFTVTDNTDFSIETITTSGNEFRPSHLITVDTVWDTSGTYRLSWDVDTATSSPKLKALYFGTSTQIVDDTQAVGAYTHDFTPDKASLNMFLYWDGITTFGVFVSNVKIVKL